ncbi:uncharacterized protein LOC115066629 [Bactrocera dorsalis]|uniref:Uncharacterized protein LOC115066629 n=1 Tax=Bactrocera dorsalis TaxID=27457 RepID=A0ABM3K2Z4_BACDO|nr:uncharacterized protein LOC115066629 [Bactrocera dorsalis]
MGPKADPGAAELTSAMDETPLQMAPEQGLDFVSDSGKHETVTNAHESGSPRPPHNHKHRSTPAMKALTLETDTTSWIYWLKKDRLVTECRRHHIAVEGRTVADLRSELSACIRAKRHHKSTEDLVQALEREMKEEGNATILVPTTTVRIPNKAVATRGDITSAARVPDLEVINSVRRWNIRYSGRENLHDFLERCEELAECYSIANNQLLATMPEILQDKALQWFRVKRNVINTWDDFRYEAERSFLPKRHLAHLEETIHQRKQFPREKAKDYVLAIQTLIRQHPKLRDEDHTERIYDGLRVEYRLYVRRSDFNSVDELLELTEEFELLKGEETRQTRNTNHCLTAVSNKYCREKVCWRCKQPGHRRHQCRNQQRIFCSRCGLDGIMSRDCNCPTHVAVRATPPQPSTAARITTLPYPERKQDGRYYLPITVAGMQVEALVDTGATLTYIGKDLQRHLDEHQIKARRQTRRIQLANQTYIPSTKMYPVTIELGKKMTHLLVSALPTLAEPVILGMDFLRKRNLTITVDGQPVAATRLSTQTPTDHLAMLTERQHLTEKENHQLNTLLTGNAAVFSTITGPSTAAEHVIRLKHDRPLKQRYYPRNPAMQEVINQEVDELLATGRIEVSNSAYSSPIVLVRKKQGSWRI